MINNKFNVEILPDEVYGLMVTRKYCDRVRNALSICKDIHGEPTFSRWTIVAQLPGESKVSTFKRVDSLSKRHCLDVENKRKSENSCNGTSAVNCASTPNPKSAASRTPLQEDYFFIPTKVEKGGRKQRTGYSLLVIKNSKISPVALSPIARQNISWVKVLTHKVWTENITTSSVDDMNDILQFMSQKLYHQLCLSIQEDIPMIPISDVPIRVDVFPKILAEDLCRSFQRCAEASQSAKESSTIEEDDAYSGPLHLTKSQSKAQYIVSVIQVNEREYMFGIDTRDEHCEINSKINDHAAGEIIVQAADRLGKDLARYEVDSYIPLSRAYYKLQQIFEDHHTFIEECVSSGGSGVDLGSSPGGWVQNLHQIGVQNILSIDPGVLAQRAEKLSGVKHWKKDFSSFESIEEMASFAPFSLIVCDASTDASEVFTKVGSTLVRVNEYLIENVKFRRLLTLPSSLVVTIKCPFKTNGSLGRILERVSVQLPSVVQSILTSINLNGSEEAIAKYTMLHLMANSDSERTVVIRFESKNKNT